MKSICEYVVLCHCIGELAGRLRSHSLATDLKLDCCGVIHACVIWIHALERALRCERFESFWAVERDLGVDASLMTISTGDQPSAAAPYGQVESHRRTCGFG